MKINKKEVLLAFTFLAGRIAAAAAGKIESGDVKATVDIRNGTLSTKDTNISIPEEYLAEVSHMQELVNVTVPTSILETLKLYEAENHTAPSPAPSIAKHTEMEVEIDEHGNILNSAAITDTEADAEITGTHSRGLKKSKGKSKGSRPKATPAPTGYVTQTNIFQAGYAKMPSFPKGAVSCTVDVSMNIDAPMQTLITDKTLLEMIKAGAYKQNIKQVYACPTITVYTNRVTEWLDAKYPRQKFHFFDLNPNSVSAPVIDCAPYDAKLKQCPPQSRLISSASFTVKPVGCKYPGRRELVDYDEAMKDNGPDEKSKRRLRNT